MLTVFVPYIINCNHYEALIHKINLFYFIFILLSRKLNPFSFFPFLTSNSKKNIRKQRMKILFNVVLEAREPGSGRRLCDLFMVKPSKKDYPDYYKIILEPMDLKIIEHNIRNDKYAGEEGMIEDMKLMFRNARHYNEEGSQVRALGDPDRRPTAMILLND